MLIASHDKKANDAYISMIINQMRSARKAYEKANEKRDSAHLLIEDFVGDIENVEAHGDHHKTLEEAVTCFMMNGECDIKKIEKKLRETIPVDPE